MFQGSSQGLLKERNSLCLKGDFRLLQQSLKDVSRKFQGFFKEDCGVFLDTFNDDSRELQGSFKGVKKKFKVCFKVVS